jgi:O-antigen/teichoic acid export membrane protein
LQNNPAEKPKTLRARILSGSFILLSGSGLATALNFTYNIAVARFLGPKGFGDATAVYTLLILLAAITLSFQIVSAKIVAQQKTPEGKRAAYRNFHRGAWASGIFIGLLLIIFERGVSNYLNLADPLLIVILAVGVSFYVPLGSRRGYLQGAYGFRRMAGSLVTEGAVRLVGSLVMIQLGFGVRGVIAANSAAVAAAYFAIIPKRAAWVPAPIRFRQAIREMLQAVTFFSGQGLINNCDIVLVKHFFAAEEAGLYAAVAMVGRVIYSLSQAVVNSMFPLVASTREEERKDLTVIATSLMLVLGLGATIALVLRFAPADVWTFLFGSRFQIAGKYNLPYLLALYAITTVTYSLSAVVITYEMSYKIANTSWVQLAFSGVVIAGICLFHSSLREVILVQLVLMVVLLFLVAVPFLISMLKDSGKLDLSRVFPAAKMIRRVSEDEVIAEFLKSDFHEPVFRDYQDMFGDIVANPNLESRDESAKRRALFFIRHLALWSELPTGTVWYELEVNETDLGQIHVFPRAQWRNLARGNFSITEVVEDMRTGRTAIDSRFQSKIFEIRDRLLQEDSPLGAVILIGMTETSQLTILDGNHRLVAAMMAGPEGMRKLRFICGFSPRMVQCCWYNTNFGTLLRYGKNVIRNGVRRPKAELTRLLQTS